LILAQNNTYSGTTTVSAGATLQIGTGGANGTLGSGAVTDDGTIVFNKSGALAIPGGINGNGSLVKAGSSAATLAVTNGYTGNTFINEGSLKLLAPNAIPDSGLNPSSSGWLILDGGVATAGLFDINGFNETVNALSGLNNTVNGRITNSGTTGTNVLTIGNDFGSDTACFASISENSTGAKIAIVKIGASLQTLSGNNSYVGGTIVQAGTLRLQSSTAAGTSPIIMSNNTTMSLNTAPGNNAVFPANDIVTPAGASVSFTANNLANGYAGAFVGTSSSTNTITGAVSCSVANVMQFTNFPGAVVVISGAELRFSATGLTLNGGFDTMFQLDGTLHTRNGTGAGPGVYLGTLTGAGVIDGPQTPPGNSTYLIGSRNLPCTFSGTINGNVAGSANNITKVGSSTLTLDGTLTYIGATSVSNGVLAISGTADLTNSATINVYTAGTLDVTGIGGTLNLGSQVAQTLSGSGTVQGSVNEAANSTVNPGDVIGKLTISGAATLNGIVNMQLNRTNAVATNDMISAGSFAGAAIVNVTNVGPDLVTGDTYRLFNTAVSGYTVNLPTTNATGSITYSWDNRVAIDGTIKVLSGASSVNTNPTNLTFSVSGGNLTISWPADHTGWRLQAQTNALAVGLKPPTNSWADVTGSTATNQMVIPVNTGNPTVFYRLAYP
jgi:autotransporter-associated beta strand protein